MPTATDEITYTFRAFNKDDVAGSVKAAIDSALAAPGLVNTKITLVHYSEPNPIWDEGQVPEIRVTVTGS